MIGEMTLPAHLGRREGYASSARREEL